MMTYSVNGIVIGLIEDLLTSERMDEAERAFRDTDGSFQDKLRAAVVLIAAGMVQAEVFVDLPDDPERLSVAELDDLVRPVAEGFLRSHPKRAELLYQVEA